MPQIFDVTANENARYKSNELELIIRNIKNVHTYMYFIFIRLQLAQTI